MKYCEVMRLIVDMDKDAHRALSDDELDAICQTIVDIDWASIISQKVEEERRLKLTFFVEEAT